MSRKTRSSILSILVICLAIACNALSTPIPTKSLSTPTIQPTEVIASPTIEVTSTTPTLDSKSQRLKDIVFSPCLTINPEPPGGKPLPWDVLVVRGIIPYAIDPNTGVKTDQLLPNPDQNSTSPIVEDFYTSPNGKWLAYDLYYDQKDIALVVEPSSNILTNSSKRRIISHPNQPSRLEGWLNNEMVVLTNYNEEKDPYEFGSTLIRNPFNGQEHEFSLKEMPNYLNYQPGMSGTYLFPSSNLMPDSTLKRLVYPALNKNNGEIDVTLWDVENKKVLASLLLYFTNDPLWSQDGNDFLIMGWTENGSIEWFQVNRDGIIQQLTHFGDFLENPEFGNPTRSWDGRYLVFQMLYNERKDSKYLFLDLKSQLLDGFCIDLGGEDSGSLQPPVWSPDGQYVAITNGIYSSNSSDIILVDVQKRDAYHISHDDYAKIYAKGWILKP